MKHVESAIGILGRQGTGGRGTVRWYRRSGAWIGIGTGPGVVMVGAAMASRTGVRAAVGGVLIGGLLLYLACVVHGLQGRRTGRTMGEGVNRVFGLQRGGAAVTGAVVAAMAGWCGFYMGVGGAALSRLLGAGQVASTVLLGAAVLGLAFAGREVWNSLVWLTAAAAVGLTVFSVAALPPAAVPEAGHPGSLASLAAAATGVIAYAVVFAMRAPDFTTDLERDRDVWLAGLTMLVPLLGLGLLGVWMYTRTGVFDLAGMLERTSEPRAGQLFLVLSVLAPSVTAVYSSSLSVRSIFRAEERRTMAAVLLIACLLGATRFDLKLVGFLEALSVVIAPALVVVLLGSRGVPARSALHAWLVGAAVAGLLRNVFPWLSLVGGAVLSGLWVAVASSATGDGGGVRDEG